MGLPRVLILAAAVLVLTNMPLAHPDFVWSSVGVLLALWQVWCHRWFAWAALTLATAVTLAFYGLSIAGVVDIGLPGWWIPITGIADILALVIWLSPPIRHWVGKQPAPAL